MQTLAEVTSTTDSDSSVQQVLAHKSLFLTDGGLETTLIFHEGWELPEFAAFPLVASSSGRSTLIRYYERYIQLAQHHGAGFILESATWRASPRWAEALGFSNEDLLDATREAIELLVYLKSQYVSEDLPILISGCVGPQDDGYAPGQRLSREAAEAYHLAQVRTMAEAGADFVSAITMTYPEEAIGICNAAAAMGIPAVISFTVETDGTLPVGIPLADAIAQVDAQAQVKPLYYMINCAHPDHFSRKLTQPAAWLDRIGGVRANSSRMSHAELDEAETLDEGDVVEFGQLHGELAVLLPNLKVVGGCCGTDHRHIDAVGQNLAPTCGAPTSGETPTSGGHTP